MDKNELNVYSSRDFYICALLTLFPESDFINIEYDGNGAYWCHFRNKHFCDDVMNKYLRNEITVSVRDFVSSIKFLKERMRFSKN